MNQKTIENYIRYCLFLAKCGMGHVSPNPPVGAILVNNNRIIGQSYHKVFGGFHAEVNALMDVKDTDKHLIADSTLYVSLEPCNHRGKTPACTELILKNDIKKLVFGCYDPNPLMAGNSITFLKNNGVEVSGPVLESDCQDMIKEFRINILEKRPFIILKLAQSNDFFMGKTGSRIKISSHYSDIVSHQWRSQIDGILVGATTVRTDNPQLTTRFWPGKNPIRILLGRFNPEDQNKFKAFNSEAETRIFDLPFLENNNALRELMTELYRQKIGILMVEGGARTLESFYKEGLWDEARIITNTHLRLGIGIPAPTIIGRLINTLVLDKDIIHYIAKNQAN
jgi:diaminohydroxyphosphoribosylaminopyrimidine deaminase / 5-amino-6-(5-phosphoribosylamino)uracil reductase